MDAGTRRKSKNESATESHAFQAEVSRLLDIVAHSLYSEREIFLRELISNASDACDRRRYAALTDNALAVGDDGYAITIATDKDAGTLTLSDNGIGMDRQEMVDNLGTIARSGTSQFLQQLTGDSRKDMALIGQFGVGFYSAFIVADKVEVLSRKAGETEAHLWTSDGKGSFTVDPAEKAEAGTLITLHMKEDAKEFLETVRLKQIVKTYSDHIDLPIRMAGDEGELETVNVASALWTRPKSEITDEQYTEFYKHVSHGFDEPWLNLHFKVEGMLEYSGLLFIPKTRPFDLFHPDRKHHVKLYVRRVFITDDCEALLPAYLRFLKGVIDSEDLPLNVSRELLQDSPMLAKIRSGVTKRVLGELKKKAEKAPDEYLEFWDAFGACLKEGLYEGFENRDDLLSLVRFRSTGEGGTEKGESWVSLADYVGRMKEGQEAIYYIVAESPEQALASPQLEGFRSRGIEVLLLSDPIDDFWLPAVSEYEGKSFKSVTRGGADLDKIAKAGKSEDQDEEKKDEGSEIDSGEKTGPLLALMKLALGEAVKDVRASSRLTDSAVCLVADDADMDMRLERVLRQHKQLEHAMPRILEINPKHRVIEKLVATISGGGDEKLVEEAAHLLLDQARIQEGETVPDPQAFARRLTDMMVKGLA